MKRAPAIIDQFPVDGTVLGDDGAVAKAQIIKTMKKAKPMLPKAISSYEILKNLTRIVPTGSIIMEDRMGIQIE